MHLHVRVEGVDLPEDAVRGEEADVEGQGRVPHPETRPLRPGKKEGHAAVRRQELPLLQSAAPLPGGDGQLELQVGVTEPDGVGTGPGRGPGGSGTTSGQQEEGDTEGEAVAKGANEFTVGRGTAPRQGGIGTGPGPGAPERREAPRRHRGFRLVPWGKPPLEDRPCG